MLEKLKARVELEGNAVVVAEMERYYTALQNAETSDQRRYAFAAMNYIYETYTFIRDLWERVETRLLKNRFIRKIKRAICGEIDWNGLESLPDCRGLRPV